MQLRRWAVLALAVLGWSAGSARGADDAPGVKLAAIEAAQLAARDRYSRELQGIEQTEAAQKPFTDRFLAELAENVEAALRLARDYPDDPASFRALQFVIRTNRAGPGDPTARALRLMLRRDDDLKPALGACLPHVALTLFQYPDAETLLRRVLDRNPGRDERASACYWLARYLRQQAKILRHLRDRPDDRKDYERYVAAEPIEKLVREKDPDALDRESEALLGRAVAEFGDVVLAGDTRPLRDFVAGDLFAIRNLGVGKVAPEIEGFDHEGRPFKLSETRGKVVVLTFSGNWCGPCVGMYPHERALVARLKDRPFALVSVSTDADVATLKQAIGSGEITWRCWWDGGTDGPISTQWGVDSFPSIFVLDPRGVIRFKNVRGDELDGAVDALLADPKPTGPASP